MVTVRYATVVLLIIAAPVFSASLVSYELQLGGNNHADSIKAGTRVAYTQGSTADNQTFYRSAPLDWAATITASGNQSGNPSDGYPIQGVANFVVNLELHQGTVNGPLATNVTYYSTIHSGTSAKPCTDCAGGYTIPGATPFCAGSAFAYAFDIVGWGASTVLEAISVSHYDGPYMEVGMYPTVDVGNSSGHGQLLGVGAGYGQWCRRCGYSTRTTKGVGIPSELGIGPVVEGQIDVSQLPVGTYVLKLNPGTGHNVLRGDVDLVTAPPTGVPEVQAFAVPANSTTGDTITFVLTDPAPALALVSVKSMRSHGTASPPEYGIQFFPTSAVECRTGSVSKIVATFNQNVVCAGGTCDASDVAFTKANDPDSYVSAVSADGAVVTITLTGQNTSPDKLHFTFPGIQDSLGRTVTNDACLRVLAGDVSGNGSVQNGDVTSVIGRLGQIVTETNYRYDVGCDGKVLNGDVTSVIGRLGQTVSTCP